MPTIILVDNSLSMCKNIVNSDVELEVGEKRLNKRDLSHIVIREVIKSIEKYDKYEYVALATFSSNSEIICPFTREYNKLLSSLETIKIGSRTSIANALEFISDQIINEWGCFTHIEIIIITDGIDSLTEDSSLKLFCENTKKIVNEVKEKCRQEEDDFDETITNVNLYQNETFNNFLNEEYMHLKFPFRFSNRLNFILLDSGDTSNVKLEYKYFNELITLNNNNGNLFITKSLTLNYIINEFLINISKCLYEKFICNLKCGHLESNVVILPTPFKFKGYQYHQYVEREIGKNIEIYGFISIADLILPPTISRHLILPVFSDEDSENADSFARMLHSSLKSENMGAIVRLADDWYGSVYSWVDSKNDPKKKSNLILSIFLPGEDVLFNALSKVYHKPSFKLVPPLSLTLPDPIQKPIEIKSYAKTCIVWLKQNNLVSDMQKVVRNAKKMPEKTQVFYKELNRIRRAALSFGFYELLEGMSQMLEREANSCTNPEALLQLNHSIRSLRAPEYKDYKNDILPYTIKASHPTTF